MKMFQGSILDQVDKTSSDINGLRTSGDNMLEPERFDFLLTIRLQARGHARLEYEGLCRRIEQILDAHTTDWKVSCIDDDDPYLVDSPTEPNLLMGDSSHTTLCVQFDTGGRLLKPEMLVLLFDAFWRLRASSLMNLRVWLSDYCSQLGNANPKGRFMLIRFNNDNSFRTCAAKYANYILTNPPALAEIQVLSGFIYEIIGWSHPLSSDMDRWIERCLKKIRNRFYVGRTKSDDL